MITCPRAVGFTTRSSVCDLRLAAVLSRGHGPEHRAYGLDAATFGQLHLRLAAQDWRLSVISAYEVSGAARYAGCWRRSIRSQFAVVDTTLADLRDRQARLWHLGWRLTALTCCALRTPDPADWRWSAVWEPGDAAQAAVFALTAEDFAERQANLAADGWHLRHLCVQPAATSEADGPRYTALWDPAGPEQTVHVDATLDEVRSDQAALSRQGWRLSTLAPLPQPGSPRFAAVWSRAQGPSGGEQTVLLDTETGAFRSRYTGCRTDGLRATVLQPYLAAA